MARDAIVIAGGGVSGAVLAALLARAGREVIVVERRLEDETKCCGCCLAPRGVRRLESLGLGDALAAAGARPTGRWRLRSAFGAVLFDESLGPRPGAVVPRDRFDAALLDMARGAGARVIRGATAQMAPGGAVVVRASGGTIERLRPWLLVGADGVGSGVARSAGLAPASRNATGTARTLRRLGISWRVDASAARSMAIDEEVIDIHLVEHGYLGFVHGADGLRVGALALLTPTRGASPAINGLRSHDATSLGRGGDALTAAIDAWATVSPSLAALGGCEPKHEADFAATGPLPWRPRGVARATAADLPGVALVGDAAGYEEPFTGEGMTWAIESAALLASVIERMLETHRAAAWDERAAAAYRHDHARAFAMRRIRLRVVARFGTNAARSAAYANCLRWAGRVPILPGAIVRSVVAA